MQLFYGGTIKGFVMHQGGYTACVEVKSVEAGAEFKGFVVCGI